MFVIFDTFIEFVLTKCFHHYVTTHVMSARLLSIMGEAKDSSVVITECDAKEAPTAGSGTPTSGDTTQSAWFDGFLDSVMPPGDMSADVASMKSLTGQPCIINVNEATMGHEYINKSSLAYNLKEINGAIDRPADYRDNPVVMVVLGSGGGKTRLLEEPPALPPAEPDFVNA
jgi:hypothetical protein